MSGGTHFPVIGVRAKGHGGARSQFIHLQATRFFAPPKCTRRFRSTSDGVLPQ
jgi:hypothetical protein